MGCMAQCFSIKKKERGDALTLSKVGTPCSRASNATKVSMKHSTLDSATLLKRIDTIQSGRMNKDHRG